MKNLVIVFVIVISLFSVKVFAVGSIGYATGNTLLQSCKNIDERLVNLQDAFDVGFCQAYILATAQAYWEWNLDLEEPSFCIPMTVTQEQFNAVVIKSLKDDPVSLDASASGMIVFSLKKAWPCKKETPISTKK